jgi:hypothetical protein
VIIEAVRTGTWNALTGAVLVETVKECEEEAARGDSTRPSYVAVSPSDLARLHAVHPVSDAERADYLLADPDAVGMDPGEQDLFAHAFQRNKRGDDVWVLCSADKASIRAAIRIAVSDQLRSLEAVCNVIGARPRHAFKAHHEERFLAAHRTEYLLGG